MQTPLNHLSQTTTIAANSANNYNGTISLSASVSPSIPGFSASFNPASVCTGVGLYCFFSNGPDSLMTITVPSNTSNGDYAITVSGNDGTTTKTVTVSLNIPSPFVIVHPPSIAPISGQSLGTTITVQSLFGFSGDVTLTSSASPTGPSLSFYPSSVTIAGSGPSSSATSTLTFGSSTIGNYSITITGTSSSFSDTEVISAYATDFRLTNNPGPTNVQAGSPYSSKVDIGSVNGFAGIVHISADVKPAGPKVTLSQDTLNITRGAKLTASVTILASNPGTYTVNVTATSGGASRSTVYTINIAEPTIFGLAPMSFYGLVGGLATAGIVGAAVTIQRRRKGNGSTPSASSPGTGANTPATSPPEAGSASVSAPGEAPPAPKRGVLSKIIPGSVQFPKPLVDHKVPILLVSAGTVLVVAALATISAAAGLFGGLFIPGVLLLGIGSVVLYSQLRPRQVGVRRFCMHCGFQMPMTGSGACPRCHKQPMSGIDTRVCPNCNAVIPTLAKFCKDCGAGQPNVPAA